MEQTTHGEITRKVFSWKRKSIDFLLIFIYFIGYVILARILSVFQVYLKRDIPLAETLTDSSGYVYTFLACIVFMSPAGVYFRKVPACLRIDPYSKSMEIAKRKRTLRYDLERTRFCVFRKPLFVILEIHLSFENSRGQMIEKLGTSIVAPKWGLSINERTIKDVSERLRAMGVEEIKDRRAKSLYEYLYD
ncbi:MAG: hypothetical protein LW688_10895 [Cryomorphaceae bacterium]|jgi:hypothetical protein|nr:hypothetical protein [Cryomorphaceae bacterium]